MRKQLYQVVKLCRVSGRRKILHKNLTYDEAIRLLDSYPESDSSIFFFYEEIKYNKKSISLIAFLTVCCIALLILNKIN
jgi:hypothetical protein